MQHTYCYRIKELCIKLVTEISLYYDARSEKNLTTVLNSLRTAERMFVKSDTEISYEKLLSISILARIGQTWLTLYTDIHKHFCTHRDSAKSPPIFPLRNEVLTGFSHH
jgi:hypothetical protein